MDDTVLKITMAAFCHDIGKLADKNIMGVSEEYIDNHAGIYLPYWNGRHSHVHAVYTAYFIEKMKDWLPREWNMPGWGDGDSFINLAAGHHQPETPMQWIIAEADRISSGFDRAEFDEIYNKAVAPKDYQKNRLLPLFEHLSPEAGNSPGTSAEYNYYYPLKKIHPKNIFPMSRKQGAVLDLTEASKEYQILYEGFVEELKGLYHRDHSKELWFEHFESLVMKIASAVPAARAGHVIPDVSLYDHLKTTAAIAGALYLFHSQTDTMKTTEIKDRSIQKFLLISGDFYGIQNFIFSGGEIQKNRSKMLRGRSFMVSLFSELAADMLCREIGLPSTAIILNAAGKFTLIAPNTENCRKAFAHVEKKLNDWLVRVSLGETAMGISVVEVSAGDFVKGSFRDTWDRLKQTMEIKKYHKIDLSTFGGEISYYLDAFNNDLAHPLCPFCGKRPSHPDAEGSHFTGDRISACQLCRDHIFIGEHLVKSSLLAVTTPNASIQGGPDNRLLVPIFGHYQLVFLDGALTEMAKSGTLLKYWDISPALAEDRSFPATTRYMNGYVPVYRAEDFSDERLLWGKKGEDRKSERIDEMAEGVPKTFAHIANKALNPKDGKYKGIEALGVLKADVDYLGILMSCGLQGERFTLSRLATLSRQLNYFFTVYLPFLLSMTPEFQDVYTVFAGGDDLFLIGPWNRIIRLSETIRKRFTEYTCGNSEIHLSAGITFHKADIPVGQLAESADAALEAAKTNGRNRLTLFGETVTWEEMGKLSTIQNELEGMLEQKWITPAMLYRLNQVMAMAGMENRLTAASEIHLADMECTKWRALLSYNVSRNAGKELKADDRPAVIDHVLKNLNHWLSAYGSKFKIPVWNILYNRRTMKI